MRLDLSVACLTFTALLSACATSGQRCHPGEQAAVADTLFFGAATREGLIPVAAWDGFVGEVVTPRFPQGLTFWGASGQWRNADGRIGREPSWVLYLVHADDAATDQKVVELMDHYKRQFHQEAVLRVRESVCMSL
jgi:hypothetical protein